MGRILLSNDYCIGRLAAQGQNAIFLNFVTKVTEFWTTLKNVPVTLFNS